MKKCLVVSNSFKKDAEYLAGQICSLLESRGYEPVLFSYNGRSASREDFDIDFAGNEFVVTLGGDGTVLYASRQCAPLGIPVFPVNLGEFGFLAVVSKENWESELNSFLDGKTYISERTLVDCEVLRGGKTVFKGTGMNDCVISSSPSAF